MNVYEFLEMTKKNPDQWRYYCEIVITRSGNIELAKPSHTEKMIELYCDKMRVPRDIFLMQFPPVLSVIDVIVEKYKYIAVWYDFLLTPPHLNRFQKKTLKVLSNNGCIDIKEQKIAKEYTWYLENKDRVNIKMEI